MSDEIRMTLLHHSTNDMIEELLMWRGRTAELLDRIAELEAENTALKQHPQPIEFWSDEKKELYRRNESRTIKSGREEECEE